MIHLVHVEPPEMPEDGWFVDHCMEVLLGKELADLWKRM